MKKLLLVLAVVAVVVGVVVAVAVYSANSLAKRFKPDIERAASNALHASVSLGNISVSLFPSINVHVEEAHIAAQPGSTEALSLKGLVLHVKLLPLLSRRVVIETVSLDEPSVTVVKTKDGIFLEGLPRPQPVKSRVEPQRTVPPVAAGGALFNIDLRKFEINHATLTLRDTEHNRELQLTNINLAAAIAMVADKVTVSSLTAQADLSGAQHASVNGAGQSFDLRTGQLMLGDLTVTIPGGAVTLTGEANVNTAAGNVAVSSDGIKLDGVLPLVAAVAPVAADLKLGGVVKPDIKAAYAGGAPTVSGNVVLQDVSVRQSTLSLSGLSGPLVLGSDQALPSVTTDGLSFVLQGKPGTIKFSAVVDGDSVRIKPLTLSALSGSLSGTVEAALAAPNRFLARLDGADFAIGEVMALAAPRARVQMDGIVTKLALDVRGNAAGDVARSLDGTAGFGMKHGTFKGFNLAAAVLNAAKQTPLLAAAIDVPRFRKYFSSGNTEIESLTGDFTIRSGWAETHNLRLESEPLTLVGGGRVSFESDVNLVATVTFNPELSRVMIGKAKELRPVLNSDGTLSIPVTVKGRPPNLDAQPDLTKLIEASTKNALQGTVGKALEKALSGEQKGGGNLLEKLLGK
jgi:uncharacterized protein involved in outer membrane biogenesis